VHDQWACESQGPIQDRTREHLGTTDKAVIAYRRLLVNAIERTQAGESAPMLPAAGQTNAFTGPPSIDGVALAHKAGSYWQEADLDRRRKSDWASARLAA
jgi:hypothetical protein